jgi:DNA-binding LytR/AlgR family response regulator
VQIPIADILYIEGLKDYVKIFVDGMNSPVMTIMNMKTLEKFLPANDFMRVHRSFIVNLSKITVIERNRIIFGKQFVPVSDSYKQIFNDYISTRILTPNQRDIEE